MSEPTKTLAEIRRAVAKELGMQFFKRYKNGYLDADTGGSTTTLVDSDLTQKDKFWTGSWLYRVASQEVSMITNFETRTNQLSLEVPVTTIAAGDDYEIHDGWNAYEIHEAINQAIRDSRRIFVDVVTDESLVIEEEKLSYSLSSLSRVPYLLHKVWIEQPSTVRRGTASAGGAATITIPTSDADGLDANWKISIYGGTGSGQLRSVSSAAGGVVTVSSNWTTVPDSTSKYALWNPTEQINDWLPWTALRLDSTKEFPDMLYFSRRPTDFYGMRIRLEYSSYPLELSAESDTTAIPMSYLVPAAVSRLHGKKVGSTKVDRELHFGESRRYSDMAQEWLMRNAPHLPDTTIFKQHSGAYQPDASDPLNWGR